MRTKNKGLLLFITILTVVLLCFGTSLSTIVGSSHDLSSVTGGGEHFRSLNEDEICIFCHTPHNAIVDDGTGSGLRLPLWNRNISRNTTGFSVYSSSTMNVTMEQPKGMTLLCLSCHDGITAINLLVNYNRHDSISMQGGADQLGDIWNPTYSRYPGMNIGGATPGSYTYEPYGAVDSDTKRLDDDHPVSFVFDDALVAADNKLKIPDVTSKLKLFNGRLECPTCHNVHEQGTDIALTKPFLRVTKDRSEICTGCHIK